jgi:hypothetical protein
MIVTYGKPRIQLDLTNSVLKPTEVREEHGDMVLVLGGVEVKLTLEQFKVLASLSEQAFTRIM